MTILNIIYSRRVAVAQHIFNYMSQLGRKQQTSAGGAAEMLTGIMHLADQDGFSFEDVLRRARMGFLDEKQQAKHHGAVTKRFARAENDEQPSVSASKAR